MEQTSSRNPVPNPQTWRKLVAPYHQPDVRKSVAQLITSFGGFFVMWVLMYLSLRYVGYWLTLLLAVPTAGFLVRIFIIQHDAGHGSFFKTRRANDITGYACGVFTMVAYKYWRRNHALHHAHSADLGERGDGDVWTMTVDEYLAAPRLKRIAYRIFRNPFFLFVIAPPIHFMVMQRLLSVWMRARATASAHRSGGTTPRSGVGLGDHVAVIGWKAFLLIHLPVAFLAASVGTWLFYVQHQYEETYWEYKPEWNYTEAALHGSSYYSCRVLRWFTGNVRLLHPFTSPRIPNYCRAGLQRKSRTPERGPTDHLGQSPDRS
ncbi:MAG: fatty acid desaturase [Caldilineaceae bacterium]